VERSAFAYYPAGVKADPGADGLRVGVDVIGVVRDDLVRALERVGAGKASVLLVARLADAAGSARELVALFDWLDAAGGDLIALDVGLDTGQREGAHVARVLRDIERWEREPRSGRPPRGRPGLARHSPGLADRIRTLREAGKSLQAIANVLNDEGVPTPRGGDHWRPSSVQAALGYRRPRPPAPGIRPPLPPRTPRRSVDQHGPVVERRELVEQELAATATALCGDTSSFEFWFGVLERYVQTNGKAATAPRTMFFRLGLGEWCSKQRSLYSQGRLSDERIERLRVQPGWEWDQRDATWEYMFTLLQRFTEREKTAIVPREHLEEGERLGRWVQRQRNVYKGVHGGGRLTKKQMEKLVALPGWTWERRSDKWEQAYRALVAFQRREGHIKIPAGHVENGVRLDAWIIRQRQHFLMGRIQRQGDHVARLEEVPGWKWSESYAERWDRHYAALEKFVKREGHANLPTKHVEGDVMLGQWVRNQRQRHEWLQAHHPSRIARLEALPGWIWRRPSAS
jgi:hypothetical protein